MVRLNLVQVLPGLVLIICASGCRPDGIDLSPDGKTLVKTTSNGVEFYDGVHQKPTFVKKGAADFPRFSADGNLIAVETGYSRPTKPGGKPKPSDQTAQCVVLNKDGQAKFSVPEVGGPFAWRPDGTELVGINDSKAVVVHIPTNK